MDVNELEGLLDIINEGKSPMVIANYLGEIIEFDIAKHSVHIRIDDIVNSRGFSEFISEIGVNTSQELDWY